MTAINFDLRAISAAGRVPVDARIRWQPVERRTDGAVVILPEVHSVQLVAGVATADLDPGYYWFTEVTPAGASAVRLVPAVGPVAYADLVEVDPATLAPSAAPAPAWLAMAGATVTGGSIVGDNLILDRTDGTTDNAGNVRGPVAPVRPAPPRPPRALIAFSFDDSPVTDRTVVMPILNEKGIKGNFCAISTTIVDQPNDPTKLSWADLQAWEAQGHEILSHSATHPHLNGVAPGVLSSELNGSYATLTAHGLTITGICWPYNENDTAARLAARENYQYGIGGAGSAVQPYGTYAVTRAPFGNTTTLAAAQATIDAAVTAKKFLIFLVHSSYDLDVNAQAVLRQVIDYAKAAAPIVTIREAMASTGNLVDVGDMITGVDYTVIDGSGKLYSSTVGPGYIAVRSDGTMIPATATPDSFLAGKVTYSEVSAALTPTTWPGGQVAAQVVTDRLQFDYWGFTLQTYTTQGRIWQRRATTATAWTAWSEVGAVSFRVLNAGLNVAADLPSAYADGTSIRLVNQANGPGTPSNIAGMLITHRIAAAAPYAAYSVQEYHVYDNGGMYRRMSNASDTGWSVWRQVTLV